MRRRSRTWSVGFVPITAMLLSCGASPQGPDGDGASRYAYRVPEQVDDGWPTGSPGSVGLDSLPFIQLMDRLSEAGDHRIHGILVVKDGVLVFEEYFSGLKFIDATQRQRVQFDRETQHFQASVSKSVTSALVGVAWDRGLLSMDDAALSYLPELSDLQASGKGAITLENLITMRSGLPWDENSYGYDDPRNDVAQLFRQADPIRFVLAKPFEAPAGTYFHYNSGCTNVLGEVVRRLTGQRLDEFADQVLFGPLGIEGAWWDLLTPDIVFASGGLRLRPRDMAKLGELYLRDGLWHGRQVVSGAWVQESIVRRSALSMGWADGYGYGWWTRTYYAPSGPIRTYFAAGWGEQQIIVAPSVNLVAVFTGGGYEEAPALSPGEIMETYVLPALR